MTTTSPEVAELAGWLHQHTTHISNRVTALARQAAEHPRAWAAHLGAPPRDALARERWLRVAGHSAAYRELRGITHPQAGLGMAPLGRAGRVHAWVTALTTGLPWAAETSLANRVNRLYATTRARAGVGAQTASNPESNRNHTGEPELDY